MITAMEREASSINVQVEQDLHPVFPPTVSIFVIMPFGNRAEYQGGHEEAEFVFNEIINPGVEEAFAGTGIHISLEREVDKADSGSITASIVNSLVRADVVIVDVTGQNANVFLELRIRYALKSRVTVLLTQEPDKIPLDIQGYRFLTYRRFDPRRARTNLASFLRRGFIEQRKSDSVVFDVFENMSVVIPGVSESHGPNVSDSKETMTWDDYMARVNWTITTLDKPMRDGRYTFDALIGISNGGWISADLIGREVFLGKPIVSLWANRKTRAGGSNFRFFDNVYNDGLCGALKADLQGNRPDEPLRLVIVDDHFGSGTTVLQAKTFLRERLGQDTKLVYFPLASRRVKFLDIVEELLPYMYEDPTGNRVFPVTKEEFHRRLYTRASFFPYMRKDIIGE